jgi:four helix bundle protein
LKSATSVGANIIEARSGNSIKNLISYYSIALRSANETYYWLRLIHETINVNHQEIEYLTKESSEIAKILGKSIVTLKQKVQSAEQK